MCRRHGRFLNRSWPLIPTPNLPITASAICIINNEQYHQAVAMYAQALAIDPHYVKARNNLGSTYMRLQMDSRALEELQQALEIDATYSLTHYNLACVYARAGDGLSAARYLQHAIEREPQARHWAQE